MEPDRRSEYSDEGIIMDTQKKKAQLVQANGEKSFISLAPRPGSARSVLQGCSPQSLAETSQ